MKTLLVLNLLGLFFFTISCNNSTVNPSLEEEVYIDIEFNGVNCNGYNFIIKAPLGTDPSNLVIENSGSRYPIEFIYSIELDSVSLRDTLFFFINNPPFQCFWDKVDEEYKNLEQYVHLIGDSKDTVASDTLFLKEVLEENSDFYNTCKNSAKLPKRENLKIPVYNSEEKTLYNIELDTILTLAECNEINVGADMLYLSDGLGNTFLTSPAIAIQKFPFDERYQEFQGWALNNELFEVSFEEIGDETVNLDTLYHCDIYSQLLVTENSTFIKNPSAGESYYFTISEDLELSNAKLFGVVKINKVIQSGEGSILLSLVYNK